MPGDRIHFIGCTTSRQAKDVHTKNRNYTLICQVKLEINCQYLAFIQPSKNHLNASATNKKQLLRSISLNFQDVAPGIEVNIPVEPVMPEHMFPEMEVMEPVAHSSGQLGRFISLVLKICVDKVNLRCHLALVFDFHEFGYEHPG